LGAAHRGGGELLIHCGREHHARIVETLSDATQLKVEPSEGRALVAAHERCGAKAAEHVEPALVEHEPDDGLDARYESPAPVLAVHVVEPALRRCRQGRCLAAFGDVHQSAHRSDGPTQPVCRHLLGDRQGCSPGAVGLLRDARHPVADGEQ